MQDARAAEGLPAQPFTGLWQSTLQRDHVLAPDLVSNFAKEMSPKSSSQIPALQQGRDVGLEVPDRCGQCKGSYREWHGCGAEKKNQCRIHNCLSTDEQKRLDSLCNMLNKFVDSMDQSAIESCSVYMWLHGDVCSRLDAP